MDAEYDSSAFVVQALRFGRLLVTQHTLASVTREVRIPAVDVLSSNMIH